MEGESLNLIRTFLGEYIHHFADIKEEGEKEFLHMYHGRGCDYRGGTVFTLGQGVEIDSSLGMCSNLSGWITALWVKGRITFGYDTVGYIWDELLDNVVSKYEEYDDAAFPVEHAHSYLYSDTFEFEGTQLTVRTAGYYSLHQGHLMHVGKLAELRLELAKRLLKEVNNVS